MDGLARPDTETSALLQMSRLLMVGDITHLNPLKGTGIASVVEVVSKVRIARKQFETTEFKLEGLT